MERYCVAIDQGTTSSRAIVFDHGGRIRAVAQKDHRQIYPRPGWVEHDPCEILANCQELLARALDDAGVGREQIIGLGIANQRETTVVWDRETGEPVYNAIVWQDTRTDAIVAQLAAEHRDAPAAGGSSGAAGGANGLDRFRERTGLPLATYFSGPKVRWILDNVPGARARAEAGQLLFGTVDSWLIWNLSGGLHLTDATNASRTLLMDLRTL
ncbi:MAG TPA: FGGY family carbohydrate kinase, partial [Mycobacterium sp.]